MRPSRAGITLVEVVVVIVIVLLLAALLLPAIDATSYPAYSLTCQSQLKQLSLVIANYESTHRKLPPAYTQDDQGNRLHSWRTLILPYIEEQALYDQIDQSQPWDNAANAQARAIDIEVYRCPAATHQKTFTSYLAVVGPDSVFTGAQPRLLSEVTDDPASTLVAVDTPSEFAVPWIAPFDLSAELFLGFGPELETHHPLRLQAAFLDGYVSHLDLDSSEESRLSMLTVAGGEALDDPTLQEQE